MRVRTINGFTVIEMLVVMAIMALAAVAAYAIFFESNKAQALDKDTVLSVTLFERARNLTLASKGNAQYGVRVEADRLVMFQGDVYVPNSSDNLEEVLNPSVHVGNYAFTGGGQDVVFDRLTGKTSQPGTLTLSLVSDPSVSKTITIYATGLIESE